MEAIDSLCTVPMFTEVLVIYFSGQREKMNIQNKQCYHCTTSVALISTYNYSPLSNSR